MKRYLKLVSIVIAFGLLITLITGCGGNSKTADNELSGLGQVDTKNLKEVTLTFYLPGEEKPDAKKVLREIEKKTKDTLNIKLDFKWYDQQDYFPQVKGMLDTGDKFDAFYYITPNSYWNFVDEVAGGKVKDLTTLLPKYAPKLYKSYSKEEIEGSKINGKLVAVPRRFQTINLDYAVVREDLMKKYKLPEIKTFDDYARYMKTIKDNEPGLVPANSYVDSLNLFTRANDYIILDRYQRLVYKKNDPNMKIQAWESTPEFKKFINYFSEWRKKGYLDNINVDNIFNSGATNTDMVNKLLSGKLASCIGGLGTAENLNASLKTTNHSNWEFKGYLLYPDKKVQKDSPINGAIAFSANSPNVERALMFMNWVNSSQENYDLFMYGILGEHYTLEGKNLKLPESQTGNPYIGWGGQDAFQNIQYERLPSVLKGDLYKTYFDLLRNDSEYPPDLGFSMSYSNVETEAKMRLMEYANDIDQPFISGTLDDNALSQALVNLKADDTDKIISELQSQLNSWRKKNKN